MKKIKSYHIRESYLNFFKKKNHKILPSASLIPEDPTILFTIAGMVPFKPIFMGNKKSNLKRVTTSQKCLRTNDIVNVGRTARHHTFFEMLGNFSFGDYFKEEAIQWAWEFFTEVIGFPKEKLYVSIFKEDNESFDLWHRMIGLSENHIVRLGEEDNFWKVGPVGPCGPCSEIYIDLGPGRASKSGGGVGVNDRYLELWNLVFMQFNRNEEGALKPLPKQNIDTGLGLERISSVLQGAQSDYETDLFLPIIQCISEKAGVTYHENMENDISLKVISDHIRALAFMISDDILPSNEGRGYVLRMLLRRAFRYGKVIGLNEPFLYDIAPEVINIMEKSYPELREKQETIYEIILTEEKRFQETLNLGLNILDDYIKRLLRGNQKVLGGKDVFTLYDTYGFPKEITKEILQEKGLMINEEEYEKYMAEQKERSRQSWSSDKADNKQQKEMEDIFQKILEKYGKSVFTGYHQVSSNTEIIAVIHENKLVDKIESGQQGLIILKETPFYAEKGGQKGDSGEIIKSNDTYARAYVYDTQMPLEGIIVHYVNIEEKYLKQGEKVKAQIDDRKRIAIAANHTATHLLHYALRAVLGEHVKQAGSSVTEEHLRFDYTHFKPLSKDELDRIERIVNKKIEENHPVTSKVTDYNTACDKGAIALFGEKYGDEVRMIDIGGFSRELCGGTHLDQTSKIGIFKIISEQSIGSGLRRIEAVTRENAWEAIKNMENELTEIAEKLETPRDRLLQKIEQIISETEQVKREYRILWKELLPYRVNKIIKNDKKSGNENIIAAVVETKDKKDLREIGDLIKEKIKSGIIILATELTENKTNIIVMITDDLINKGYDAGKIIKPIADAVNGRGGGKKHFAQAGGTNSGKLKEIFNNINNLISN